MAKNKKKHGRMSKVTPEMITGMYIMREGGLTFKNIAETCGVSMCTVHNVKRAGWDFEQYRALVSGQIDRWKSRKAKKSRESVQQSTVTTSSSALTIGGNGDTGITSFYKEDFDSFTKRLNTVETKLDALLNAFKGLNLV
jgi:hypothetical protein